MKDTAGWLASFLFFLFVSSWLMYKAIETIPVSAAYAVWTGIGSAGTVIAVSFSLKNQLISDDCFLIGMLIISLAGLRMVSE